jgi:hypothetical protein
MLVACVRVHVLGAEEFQGYFLDAPLMKVQGVWCAGVCWGVVC